MQRSAADARIDAQDLSALDAALAGMPRDGLLFGLDVDGTLVDHDGWMSSRVHDVLERAAAQQTVVIATGRSIGATLPIVELAGIERGFAVCSNGGVTIEIDPEAERGYRVIDTRTFDPAEGLRRLSEVAPHARFALETPDGGFFSTGGFQDDSFGVEAEPIELEDLLRREAVRVVVHDPDLSPDEFSEIVAEAGVHGVEYAIGWSAWLDMTAPGVSKASALEAVRERLGLDREATVVIGDGSNDLEMFRWAQLAVAMGQATERVASEADARTAPVDADGAALVLEALVGRPGEQDG